MPSRKKLGNRYHVPLYVEKRIRPYVRETPVEHSLYLSRLGECKVFMKLENYQITGSFKVRGAMNKLFSLSEEEKKAGIVTASSGNHGIALAYGLKTLGLKGIIYLPCYTSESKIEALRDYDVDLEFYGDDCLKTEEFARRSAEENNQTYIPPYNDWKIIAGQATVAVELARQISKMDAVLVPVGGGGLISGIAGYLKSLDKSITIIGCQPENSAVMWASIKAGRIVRIESQPTLSDGTAGGIEQGSLTFDICRKHVDDFILVSEEEIRDSMRLILARHSMLIEGAAALPVASFIKAKNGFKGKTVVLVLSGCRISTDHLRVILS
ncbi:MAG: threonine/serine dehydratase [Candidatus Aminicenantales bacterium]